MQPDLRKALLDTGEEPLKPINLELGMKTALHQHTRAAHLHRLSNLFVDLFKVEDVALRGTRIRFSGSGQRPIEGAEGAVLGAEVGVVDVAIDDVGDHAFRVQLAAHSVRFKSQADEVRGVEVVERLLAGQSHTLILPS